MLMGKFVWASGSVNTNFNLGLMGYIIEVVGGLLCSFHIYNRCGTHFKFFFFSSSFFNTPFEVQLALSNCYFNFKCSLPFSSFTKSLLQIFSSLSTFSLSFYGLLEHKVLWWDSGQKDCNQLIMINETFVGPIVGIRSIDLFGLCIRPIVGKRASPDNNQRF